MGKERMEYKGYVILKQHGRYELFNSNGEMIKATSWAGKAQLAELTKYVDSMEK